MSTEAVQWVVELMGAQSGYVLAGYRKIHNSRKIFLSRPRQQHGIVIVVYTGAAKTVEQRGAAFVGLFDDVLPDIGKHERAVSENISRRHQ